MLNFLKRFFFKIPNIKLFIKAPNIKKFSSTITDAKEGSNAKKDLNPKISKLIKRLKKGDEIKNHELNELIQFYFNVEEILPGYYRFNESIINGMVFDIVGIQIETDINDDITSIHLTMNEITYNIDFTIRISVKDFHDVFSLIKFIDIHF